MKALPVALRSYDHEDSHWLRTMIAQIPPMWDRHGVLCCSHVVTWSPLDLALWVTLLRPTGLVCGTCLHLLPTDPSCARCRTVPVGELTGLAVVRRVRGRTVHVAFGLCDGCLGKELPA